VKSEPERADEPKTPEEARSRRFIARLTVLGFLGAAAAIIGYGVWAWRVAQPPAFLDAVAVGAAFQPVLPALEGCYAGQRVDVVFAMERGGDGAITAARIESVEGEDRDKVPADAAGCALEVVRGLKLAPSPSGPGSARHLARLGQGPR
jgi:hypothetical protein